MTGLGETVEHGISQKQIQRELQWGSGAVGPLGKINRANESKNQFYREIMAVCSEIHKKHINTLCGQNVELLNVKLTVHIVTTGL